MLSSRTAVYEVQGDETCYEYRLSPVHTTHIHGSCLQGHEHKP